MQHVITLLLAYDFLTTVFLPVILADDDEAEEFSNDSIIDILLVSFAVMDAYYMLLYQNTINQKYVSMKHRNVSDIFSEQLYSIEKDVGTSNNKYMGISIIHS